MNEKFWWQILSQRRISKDITAILQLTSLLKVYKDKFDEKNCELVTGWDNILSFNMGIIKKDSLVSFV